MAAKKHKSAPPKTVPKQAVAPATSGARKMLLIAGAVVVAVVLLVQFAGRAGKDGGSAPTASAEEAKYLGLYLPDAYSAPKVAESGKVTETTKMTPIKAEVSDTGVSITSDELSAAKIVSFDYQKSETEVVPMIAYVKPSGQAFVGVSYCIPCKGVGQWLDADGTLTCESCGTKRDPETGVGISGACKLYPLDEMPAILEGGKLTIDRAILDTWKAQPLDRPVG